jgi:sec-independent protein translocase protein TatA
MIIFGAGKLPEIGSAFGRSIKNFKSSMKEAQEEEGAQVEEGKQATIEEGKESESEENLTDEEKEALARKKAQEEGDAKDLAMKETADSFTASLPRKGSYDFNADQEKS